jgi:hypothetical protein
LDVLPLTAAAATTASTVVKLAALQIKLALKFKGCAYEKMSWAISGYFFPVKYRDSIPCFPLVESSAGYVRE